MAEDWALYAKFARALAEISQTERVSGRAPGSVTLVAVSKTQPVEAILAAIACGQLIFGENRVAEAAEKFSSLRSQRPEIKCPEIKIHLIGPLQTNKVRLAVGLFNVIETVDRESLAAALAAERDRVGVLPECLIQVNTGEEPQKSGVFPSQADAFIQRCLSVHRLPVRGLMCIPPLDRPPGPHFALLADLAARHDLPVLSMGMSGDFTTAIRFGATHVRLGSALFGERDRAPPHPAAR